MKKPSDKCYQLSGVYGIRHKTTGKIYVGSSCSKIWRRWLHHSEDLTNNKHHSILLQRAWNKYGENSFELVVLENCEPDKCLDREQYWIDYYCSSDPQKGYNIAPYAGNCRGVRHTEETRSKLSAARIGNKYALGHRHTQETKARIGNASRGNKYRLGTKFTDEQKIRLGAAHKGIKHTQEAKDSISATKKGRKFTDEHRSNLSLSHKGHKPTDETRAKLSAKLIERHKRQRELKALRNPPPICHPEPFTFED